MSRFKYNKTMWDFKEHIDQHRQRVIRMTLALCLRLGYITGSYHLMSLHDIEKYLFLPWLWSYYGNRRNRKQARKLYDRMNKVGSWIRKFYIWYFDISPKAVANVDRFERIADIVDRHCHEATLEEFGITEQRPLSDFLSDPEDLAIAEWLKAHYEEFKKGFSTLEMVERQGL